MDCRELLAFILLATFDLQVEGKLIVKPTNQDVKVNHTAYLNCSTDYGSSDIFWYHGTKYVYTGFAILEPYHERFYIDRNEWNGTYVYNLVIHSVQPEDAGEYICAEDEGYREKYSVQLIVLEDDPICRSNIELNEVIGQNECNMEPDEVKLECSVAFHGNIPPQMKWKKAGESGNTPLDVSVVTHRNHLISTLMLKGDIALNSTSYVCESNRTNHKPYKCSSKVMNILYAVSDNFSLNKTTEDEIHCSANTSQSCSYKWRWLQDNDFTVESSTSDLKAKKPGWHRCEAECLIRNKTCNLLVMRVMVRGVPVTESSQTRNIIISVVVTVVVTVAALCVLVVVLIKCDESDTECCSTKRNAETHEELAEINVPEIPEKRQPEICGLTVLHEEVFILRYKLQDIEVYESTIFNFQRRMNVNGMTNPENIVSCSVNNCLYATDLTYQEKLPAILRFDPINGNLIKAWRIHAPENQFSVASDGNVILCPDRQTNLQEYTANGELIRTINLGRDSDGRSIHAKYAAKLDSGLFVVCESYSSVVYLLSTKETPKLNIFERIDEIEIRMKFRGESGELIDKLDLAMHFSVNKEGSVLVLDTGMRKPGWNMYYRAVLLSPNFDRAGILLSTEDGVKSLTRSCFDESTCKWLVTDGNRIFACWLEDEKVVRKIHDLIIPADTQNDLS